MAQQETEKLSRSRLVRGALVLLATYTIVGIPVLHVWSPSYFKGANLLVYQGVFVAVFCALWLAFLQLRDPVGSLGRLIAWGAGAGFVAGAIANGVADYSVMEPDTSIGAWITSRVTVANVVLLNLALLSWLFGAAFGAATWLIQHHFGHQPASSREH